LPVTELQKASTIVKKNLVTQTLIYVTDNPITDDYI